jgi:hypothetical protein
MLTGKHRSRLSFSDRMSAATKEIFDKTRAAA